MHNMNFNGNCTTTTSTGHLKYTSFKNIRELYVYIGICIYKMGAPMNDQRDLKQ